MMFGSQETIHFKYSYLNETLGLEDFSIFAEPQNSEKFELLTSTTASIGHMKIYKLTKTKTRSW